jgi:hypothetical protein
VEKDESNGSEEKVRSLRKSFDEQSEDVLIFMYKIFYKNYRQAL